MTLRLPFHAAGLLGLLLAPDHPAEAALSPAYQRLRELTAAAEAAAPKLSDPIDVVRRIAPDRFEVEAGACRLEVRIVPHPPRTKPDAPPAPGSFPFAAIAGEAACR